MRERRTRSWSGCGKEWGEENMEESKVDGVAGRNKDKDRRWEGYGEVTEGSKGVRKRGVKGR